MRKSILDGAPKDIWSCDRVPILVPASEDTAWTLRRLAVAQGCTVQDVIDQAVVDYAETCPLLE